MILGDVEPGMLEHVSERQTVLGPDAQASPDQVLAFRGHVPSKMHLCVADLLVLLEGYVPLDHVIEEYAEGPHGEGVALVARAPDPLRRGIHTSS